MANSNLSYRDSMPQNSSALANSASVGICMMSSAWRDEQSPSFIKFISSFLSANSTRLNFVPISPDFIFNCAGLSVAFIFVTNWNSNDFAVFSRVQKLKLQFANLYIVVTLPTREQNDSFVHSYFKYGIEFGNPTFVPVQDLEMGFEKIVKIAHSRGGKTLLSQRLAMVISNLSPCVITSIPVCRREDAKSKLKAERKKSVQGIDVFTKVITCIPGINSHDANMLGQMIGSVEDIAKASKEYIIENTDLSAGKAEVITKFFRDPKFYLSPNVNGRDSLSHNLICDHKI